MGPVVLGRGHWGPTLVASNLVFGEVPGEDHGVHDVGCWILDEVPAFPCGVVAAQIGVEGLTCLVVETGLLAWVETGENLEVASLAGRGEGDHQGENLGEVGLDQTLVILEKGLEVILDSSHQVQGIPSPAWQNLVGMSLAQTGLGSNLECHLDVPVLGCLVSHGAAAVAVGVSAVPVAVAFERKKLVSEGVYQEEPETPVVKQVDELWQDQVLETSSFRLLLLVMLAVNEEVAAVDVVVAVAAPVVAAAAAVLAGAAVVAVVSAILTAAVAAEVVAVAAVTAADAAASECEPQIPRAVFPDVLSYLGWRRGHSEWLGGFL